MTVYIEYLIADNFCFTYAIGALSQRFSGMMIKKVRVAICAILGTAVAIVYPFIYSSLAVALVRVSLWLVLSAILFFGSKKSVKGALIFLLLTFLFGGITFGINFIICKNAYMAMRVNACSIPLSVIVVSLALGYALIKKICLSIRRSIDASKFVYSFEVVLLGKRIKAKGLMDTGNRLYDEKSGLPIIILSAKRVIETLDNEQIALLLTGRGEKIQPCARYITISSVTEKESKILLLKPEKFLLYSGKKNNIMNDVTIGVSFAPMTDAVEYDAILHPSLIAD